MKPVPRKYHPKGFPILFEDEHLIVGNKAAGLLTVGANWERENTVHHLLNQYVRKGNLRSHKHVFVVHRLDQHTSGLLIFAKSERVQESLKDNWKDTQKTYYAVVHGKMEKVSGLFESYLFEDDKYVVHSFDDPARGKFAQTAYTLIKVTPKYSLVKIDLLTGRKNQIRVHFACAGHPLVGDTKYGRPGERYPHLALHAKALSFTHPVTHARLSFETELPKYFDDLVGAC